MAAVLFALLSAACAAFVGGETYDEPEHLEWSRRLLETGETERVSNPRFNAKTPVMLANVAVRKLARRSLGVRDQRVLRFLARTPAIVWLGLSLGATFLLARAWLGPGPAHLATLIAALDPNLVAHGSLATVDSAFTLATLGALAAAWHFGGRPGPARGALLGLALGLAFAVKFTAVLLLASLPLLIFARRPAPSLRGAARAASGLAVAAAVACLVLCAAYLWSGVGSPLSQASWRARALAELSRAWPGLRLPLPLGFLSGLDILVSSERTRPWNVVILGGLHPDGVWFYFLLLWLVKTPVLILVSLVLGLARATRRILATPPLRFLALCLLLQLGYFSLVFRAQVGYRFVLMCVPLAAILAAAGLYELLDSRRARLLLAGAALVAVAENLAYLGNPLAFSNAAVWPKRQVFRLIADSNVDWGQNDEKIAGWLEKAGVSTALNPAHLLPGHNTIGLNLLAGVAAFPRHRWLRENLEPRGHFGHTYLWFQVDAAAFERFLAESRTLSPREQDSRLCGGEASLLRNGAPATFEEAAPAPPGWAPLLCLEAAASADVGLHGASGSATLARAGEPLGSGESVAAGQVLIYRLQPGRHAFVVGRLRGFQGDWSVSRDDVSLGMRLVKVDRRFVPVG